MENELLLSSYFSAVHVGRKQTPLDHLVDDIIGRHQRLSILDEEAAGGGVLMEQKDITTETLTAAIAGLLGDPARRTALGERARERILEQFCWRRAAREMTRYYEQVLASHGNRQP